MSSVFKEGLEDIVVSTSEICFIDGREGRLLYRGYDVDDLVQHSSFEEVVYLLWNGSLPSRKDLETHVKALSSTANRKLPPKLVTMLRQLPKKTTPMEVLRTGVSALAAFDPDAADNSREATTRKAIRLTAQMPTLVAAWERLRRGKAPIAPDPRLNLAANFPYMMFGKKPSPLADQHVREVGRQVQPGIRRDGGLAAAQALPGGDQRGHLRGEPDRLTNLGLARLVVVR